MPLGSTWPKATGTRLSSALERAAPRCVRHEVVLALLRARALLDHHAEALKSASTAIDLAVSNGMLQTVASEGAEIVELVEASAWRASPHWLDRFRRTVSPIGAVQLRQPVDLVEPLTDRELDVVRFLPSRLNGEGDRRRALHLAKYLEIPSEGHIPQVGRQLPRRSERGGPTDDGGPLRVAGGVHERHGGGTSRPPAVRRLRVARPGGCNSCGSQGSLVQQARGVGRNAVVRSTGAGRTSQELTEVAMAPAGEEA